MKINNPEKNKIINFFLLLNISISNLILLLKQIVKNKKTIVHNTLCETTSTGSTKDIYLKYKTPITPHQKDPKKVDIIPLLKLDISHINKQNNDFIYNFLVELNNYTYKT